MENLEEWDYGTGSELNITIENRKVLITKSVTVGHLEIKNGGVLVFGEPEDDEIELKALSVRDLKTKNL